MVCVPNTCNIFDKNKVENIAQVNIDLTDHHGQTVGKKEHHSEAQNTTQVAPLLNPRLLSDWRHF